jgi:ribonuclease P protein component
LEFFVALPKQNRLKHRQDFKAVYQQGIRCSGRHLTLRALRQRFEPSAAKDASTQSTSWKQANYTSPSQIGISISQKVSKKAVVRNRIKRQIRAIFAALMPRLAPGWLLVVIVRPTALSCEYGQFLRELEQLLAEAEVLNGHS